MNNKTNLILASGNRGKLTELRALLVNTGFSIKPQSEFDVSDAIEDGLSFVENAIIKARHACFHTGLPAIADDSGLEVDYLLGAPGIYSARYAGEDADDQANIQKLLAALNGVPGPERGARFRCTIVYMRHDKDPSPLIAEGCWEGTIAKQECGENGFGYDPVFLVPSHHCTSAQLTPEQKNTLSHRGQALLQLQKKLLLQSTLS